MWQNYEYFFQYEYSKLLVFTISIKLKLNSFIQSNNLEKLKFGQLL